MYINVIGHPQKRGFSLIHLLFGNVSGSFQPFLGCYVLFQVTPPFTTNDVTECFDLQSCCKSTSCRFYYTVVQMLMYYTIEKFSSQSGTVVTVRSIKNLSFLLVIPKKLNFCWNQ